MIGATKVIGITGSIASGKSLVGRILSEQGFPVIDTDEIVHDLFARSESLKQALSTRFGESILTADSRGVDRQKLGALVFSDGAARKDLESIVHPATINECDRRVRAAAAASPLVFVLVPLLFEARQEHRYDEIWVVHTDPAILRERLRLRNALTDEEIDARLKAQLSQEEKVSRASRVINNSGTIAETEAQVAELIAMMQKHG